MIHDQSRLDELKGNVDLLTFLDLESTAKHEGLFDDQLYVAEIKDLVVGFIAYNPEEITWLYVDPAQYRKGIADALLQFAIPNCANQITVEVLSRNIPAIKLYEKHGFVIQSTVKGKLTGNEAFDVEGHIMELRKIRIK